MSPDGGPAHEWVRQADLDALCPELRAVVDDAVAAGNSVVATWREFGQAAQLATPEPVLVALPEEVVRRLRYRAVDDTHYWLGEILCTAHHDWFVCLPFGTGASRSTTPAQALPPV